MSKPPRRRELPRTKVWRVIVSVMPADKKSFRDAAKHAKSAPAKQGVHTRFEGAPKNAHEDGQAQRAASAALQKSHHGVGIGEAIENDLDFGDVPATRQEEIESLQTIGKVNELIATNDAVSIKLVALRSGRACKAYYDETATYDMICACEKFLRELMNDLLYDLGDGWNLKDLSEDGKVNLAAARSGNTKNRRNGQMVVRIDEVHYEYFERAIDGLFSIAPADPDELEYEAMAGETFYPGAILEQMYEQAGVHATVRYSREAKANIYLFSFESEEAQEAAIQQGYIIKLGKEHGTMPFRPVQKKIQMEECFLYGFTGPASAKDLFLPLYAQEVGCSKDMARLSRAQGIRDGVGTVIKVTFPYSKASYKRFMKLIAIERFKLVVEGHAIEVTIAMTPVELGKILQFRLMAEVEEEEQEELSSAIDLRIEEVTPQEASSQACKRSVGGHVSMTPECMWVPFATVGEHSWFAINRSSVPEFEPVLPPAHPRGEEVDACKLREEQMHSCAFETPALDSHAGGGLHWQRRSGGRAERHEPAHVDCTQREHSAPAESMGAVCTARLQEDEGGRARGQGRHWVTRPLDHLLRWGYDARGCGGGKSK